VKLILGQIDDMEKDVITEDGEERIDSIYKIFLDYTEHSTIQGLIYIFLPYQVNHLPYKEVL